MIKGKDILRFIPQRYPMVMLDEFEPCDEKSARTALTVRTDNLFVDDMGELHEPALIEHIAQSASALAGYNSQQGEAPIGIIGEVKHFVCHRHPLAGEKIESEISFGFSFGNVTIATGTSRIDGEAIAEAQLKIFMQQ